MKRTSVRFLVCLVLAAAVGFSVARATETTIVTFDGAWWNGLPSSQKLIAVEGILVGYDRGLKFGAFKAAYSGVKPTINGYFYASDSRRDAIIAKAIREGSSGGDRTFGTMVGELDAFFSDQAARQKTLVSDEVLCAITSGEHCR